MDNQINIEDIIAKDKMKDCVEISMFLDPERVSLLANHMASLNEIVKNGGNLLQTINSYWFLAWDENTNLSDYEKVTAYKTVILILVRVWIHGDKLREELVRNGQMRDNDNG